MMAINSVGITYRLIKHFFHISPRMFFRGPYEEQGSCGFVLGSPRCIIDQSRLNRKKSSLSVCLSVCPSPGITRLNRNQPLLFFLKTIDTLKSYIKLAAEQDRSSTGCVKTDRVASRISRTFCSIFFFKNSFYPEKVFCF